MLSYFYSALMSNFSTGQSSPPTAQSAGDFSTSRVLHITNDFFTDHSSGGGEDLFAPTLDNDEAPTKG
jgi:hypothetical protein